MRTWRRKRDRRKRIVANESSWINLGIRVLSRFHFAEDINTACRFCSDEEGAVCGRLLTVAVRLPITCHVRRYTEGRTGYVALDNVSFFQNVLFEFLSFYVKA